MIALESYKRVLYIGANEKRFQLYRMLRDKELHVLEVFRPYAEALQRSRRHPVTSVIVGDVRGIAENAEVKALGRLDLLVWWHGPEHVCPGEAEALLRPGGILEAFWAKAILLGCPWGIYPQGPVDGNEAQRHLATFYPDWFERLGYTVECTGKPDKPSGNLAAWRMREAP